MTAQSMLMLAVIVTQAPPLEKSPVETKRVWTSVDAVQAAAADLAAMPIVDQPHQFYLWVRNPTRKTRGGLIYALNSVSRAQINLKPYETHGGRLMRLDLREWKAEKSDRERFERVIASYVDPYFYVATGTIQDVPAGGVDPLSLLRLPAGAVPVLPFEVIRRDSKYVTLRCRPFNYNGKKWTSARVSATDFKRATNQGSKPGGIGGTVAAGRESPRFSPLLVELAPDATLAMQSLTGRVVSIVDAERWLVHSLSTIDGGIYYDLMGFTGLTQDQWLELWGADIEDARRQSEYIGQWESGVTGQPRRAVFTVGRKIRQSTAYPLVVLTEDVAEGSFDPTKHPIYSLGDTFKHDAVEALAMMSNGYIATAIFDGKGAIQDEAPPEIVADRTKLKGSTRLQPAISCIRCHGGVEGWKDMPNHVQTMLGEKVKQWRLRPLAEVGEVGDITKQLMTIAEKYSGDLTLPIKLARDSHHSAVFDSTGMTAVDAAQAVTDIFNAYQFSPISPQQACAELGVQVDEASALEMFNQILPPPSEASIGLALEDPAVHTIRGWGKSPRYHVSRLSWEANYMANLARALREGSYPE